MHEMIIVVGLPRCGTTSFDVLLRGMGLKTLHSHTPDHAHVAGRMLARAQSEGRELLHYVRSEGYDAVTELNYSMPVAGTGRTEAYWPQTSRAVMERLRDENPGAAFILNTRDLAAHARSLRRLGIDALMLRDMGRPSDESIERVIEETHAMLRDVFGGGGARFAEFRIDEDDVAELAGVLGAERLAGVAGFPHANRAAEKHAHLWGP